MTPKSMLRHSAAASPAEDFNRDNFLTVIPDDSIEQARRILVCSGKVGHELRKEREKREDDETAIVFLEQFYPFPEEALREAIDRYQDANEVIWVQEEPANMGGLFFVYPKLQRVAGSRKVRSIKRSPSGSPATGSAKAHQMEQETLIKLAFSGTSTRD